MSSTHQHTPVISTPLVIPARSFVIPAKAGIHSYCSVSMDPRLRGDDKKGGDDIEAFFSRCTKEI